MYYWVRGEVLKIMSDSILDLVWATDENYVFLTGVSVVSALENNRDFDRIRVWILADNVSEQGKKQLTECVEQYNREIQFLNTEEYLAIIKQTGAREWGKASFSTYSRLFIADIMEKYDVHKVIYCDCDLIIDGSLEEIWKYKLENKVLGMVKEYNRIEIRDLLGLSRDSSYYQAGFLLIDIDAWKKRKCTEKILEHMQKVSAVYPFVDQDLLNCVLHDEICTLPIQYNVNPRAIQYSYKELIYIYGLNGNSYYTEKEFNDGLRNGNEPVVYHCSDPCGGRPWQIGNHHIFTEKWDYYYKNSMWSTLYQKREYNPSKLAVIEYYLYSNLPKYIYIRILKTVSKRAMIKSVKMHTKYQRKEL